MEQMQLSFDSIPMTSEEKAVWGAIEPHRGRGCEIQVTAVARNLAIPERRARQVVSHLVNTHHKLIGSNGNGYYVAVTPDEIEVITRSLRHRGIMILVRAASIQKGAVTEVFKQGLIEFERSIADRPALPPVPPVRAPEAH